MNCNTNYYFWTVLIAAVIIFSIYNGNNNCGCNKTCGCDDSCC
jgi:hypothetical protein